jgi:hypothetical protein
MTMIRNLLIAAAAIAVSLACCRTCPADLQGYDDLSLEWLVDSSDAIAIAEIAIATRETDWGDTFRVTRAIKDHKQLRVGQTVKGSSSDGNKGDRVMLFLREKAGGLSLFRVVSFTLAHEIRVDDGQPEEDSPHKFQTFLAIDKKGNIISSEAELIRRVQERIRAGSLVPADCDREAVETEKSVKGGFKIELGCYQLPSADICVSVIVPPDPEFRAQLEKEARKLEGGRSHAYSAVVARRLRKILQENYEKPASGKK